MIELKQQIGCKLIVTVKTVEWLVDHAHPNVFRFDAEGKIEGYQREINDDHVNKIIYYIKEKSKQNLFYFPSNIICSKPYYKNNLNDGDLYIVDGQHRIRAFELIRYQDRSLFEKIRSFQLPVLILDGVDEDNEISTFITINKKNKKVDTSLALILQNKIRNIYTDSSAAKVDYLAVWLAQELNEKDEWIWRNQIAFEGSAKEKNRLLSLNAFVKATRRMIRCLEKIKLISLDFSDKHNLEEAQRITKKTYSLIWKSVSKKWDELFEDNQWLNTVIAGPIGVTSILKYIAVQLGDSVVDESQLEKLIVQNIARIDLPVDIWKKGGAFSKYTSESGYSKIVKCLQNNELEWGWVQPI